MNITRRHLALGSLAMASLPVLTACKTLGELQPMEIPPGDRAESQQPFGAVDVVVVSRPSMQSKLNWLGKPIGTVLDKFQMEDQMVRAMQSLRSELQDVLHTGGLPGLVTLDGRRATPARTHVLLIVPVEASLSHAGSTVHFSTTVEMRLMQVADKRSVWRAQTKLSSGPEDRKLAQAVLAQLQALAVPLTPRPPQLARVEGLAVQLDDALPAVQAALGPAAELKKESGVTTLHAVGIMAQFNAQDRLVMLRLRPPATAAIRGVSLGQRWPEVVQKLGEPHSLDGGGGAFNPVISPLSADFRGPGHRLTVKMELSGVVREIQLNSRS